MAHKTITGKRGKMTEIKPKKPKIPGNPLVFITPGAKAKLDAYASVAKGEIAGLGEASVIAPNTFLIEDVYIFAQETTYTEASLNTEALMNFMQQWLVEGKDLGKIKVQWHSHANMGTFWSSDDEDNITGFDNGATDWMLSLETNKSGDCIVRLDIFHPLRVTVTGLSLQLLPNVDSELLEAIKQEVAQKVKFTPPQPINGKGVVYFIPTEEGEEESYAESVE